MASVSHSVKVYIYDVSRGMAKAMSEAFLGRRLEGIWHTGIVVYGREFFYGGMGGIEHCRPGGTIMGQPDTIHELGTTQVPYDMFVEYLADLSQSMYRPDAYHLLEHNCNSFSSDIAQFLTGNDIPAHITGLPAEVLSTPFGQMIKPFIDSMSVQPSGGHAMFPQGQSQAGAAPTYNPTPSNKPPTSQAPSIAHPAASHAQSTGKPPVPATPAGSKVTDKAHTFSDPVPVESVWEDESLSRAERDLVRECYEFLAQTEPDWSLGRGHVALLYRLAQDGGPRGVRALTLLQALVRTDDVSQLIHHDPAARQSLVQLLQKFDDFTETVKCEVIKLVTNCCSQPERTTLVRGDTGEPGLAALTSGVSVSGLLADSTQLTSCGAALAYNLSLHKVPEDTQLELGSALLNCLNKDLEEQTAFHILAALRRFIDDSPEVQGLATLLGTNVAPLRNLSERVAALCTTFES